MVRNHRRASAALACAWLICSAVHARADCRDGAATRAFRSLTEAEQSLTDGDRAGALSSIEKARRLLRESDCNALSRYYAEMGVAEIHLRRDAAANALRHLQEAYGDAQTIQRRDERVFAELGALKALLPVQIESGRVQEARSTTTDLQRLLTAEHERSDTIVDTLWSLLTAALVANEVPKVRAYEEAIDQIASGEVRVAWDIFKLTMAADAHLGAGEYGAAFTSAREARRLLEASPAALRTMQALYTLLASGWASLSLNDPREAMAAFTEADTLAPDILAEASDSPGDLLTARFALRKLYGAMAAAQLALHQTDAAERTLAKATEVSRVIGLGELETIEIERPHQLQRMRAQILMARGGGAPDSRRRAERFLASAGDDVGSWLLRLGGPMDPAEAGELRRRLDLVLRLASPAESVQLRAGAARVFARTGDDAGSIEQSIAAIDLIEQGRLQARESPAQTSFFAPLVTVYDDLVDLLYRKAQTNDPFDARLQGYGNSYAEASLSLSEAAHTRQFAERYGPALRDAFVVAAAISPSDRQRERELRDAMARASGPTLELLQPNNLKAARERSEKATKAYIDYLTWLGSQYPDFARLAFPRPTALRDLPPALDRRFVVSYKVTAAHVYWWVVSNHAIAAFGRSDVGAVQLRELIKEFLRLRDEPDAGQSLSTALVDGPFRRIQELARRARTVPPRVTVVPDDVLYFLPWEALPAPGGGHVADAFATAYAPSLTVLAQSMSVVPSVALQRRALVVANVLDRPVTIAIRRGTDVFTVGPGSAQVTFHELSPDEPRKVTGVLRKRGYDVALLEGAAATPESLVGSSHTSYSLIHFDTHAFAETIEPPPSLVLHPSVRSPEGLLTLASIPTLQLRAHLVTVSACMSNLGPDGGPLAGEGVQSIARMFLLAGSRSVLASMWLADALATAALMERFYEELGPSGAEEDLALFRARAAVRRAGFTDPSKWAAFVLIGGPRE